MILPTEEDRFKCRIYNSLDVKNYADISDYFRDARKKEETEKYAKHWFKQPSNPTLVEELFSLAYSHYNTPEDKKRDIDRRALKTIKRHKDAKKSGSLQRQYYREYQNLKRGFYDLMKGHIYIEDQIEDFVREPAINKSLEEKLRSIAKSHNNANSDKKRKYDYEALKTIKRCSSCKNSPSKIRGYYRIYKEMT